MAKKTYSIRLDPERLEILKNLYKELSLKTKGVLGNFRLSDYVEDSITQDIENISDLLEHLPFEI